MRNFESDHILVAVLLVCISAVSIHGCRQVEQTERVKYVVYADAVSRAPDPIVMGCAFGTAGSDGNTAICIANQVKK